MNVKPEDLMGPTERDRLLKLVDSYAKLVDRLEEQIEALSRERVAANQLGVDPNQCTTLR